MPTKERKLKAIAVASAGARKHTMPHKWERLGPHTWCKECKVCGYEMVVNTKPAPNEISLSPFQFRRRNRGRQMGREFYAEAGQSCLEG